MGTITQFDGKEWVPPLNADIGNRPASRVSLYFAWEGCYVACGHTPLLWTQANQALALHLMERSVSVKLGTRGLA